MEQASEKRTQTTAGDHMEAPLMSNSARLDSWKEIAIYLNRNVRTVQRWEKGEGLPVHRHRHQKGSSVCASKEEIDAWLKRRCQAPPDFAQTGKQEGLVTERRGAKPLRLGVQTRSPVWYAVYEPHKETQTETPSKCEGTGRGPKTLILIRY